MKIPGGTVFKRKSDGRWVANLRYMDGTGKERTKSKTVISRVDGNRALKAMFADLVRGTTLARTEEPPKRDSKTFGWWAETAMKEIFTEARLRASTRTLYRNWIKYQLSSLHKTPLDKLTVDQLQAVIDGAKKTNGEPMSFNTVCHIRTFLVNLLGHAERRGLVQTNLARRTLSPRQARKPEPKKPLTIDEVRQILDELPPSSKLVFKLQVNTGMRIGEVLGLRWEDLNEQTGEISLVQQVVQVREGKGGYGLGPLKTEKSRRTLRIPPKLLMEILTLERRSSLIFCTAKGKILSSRNVSQDLYDACDRLERPRVSSHILRHTYASLTLNKGVPLEVVQEILGHTDLRTTQRYAKVSSQRVYQTMAEELAG